jgi:regulatory protein
VQQVLDDLAEQGLLSERRYVESYVDERIRKGFGPLRIEAELRERGVDEGLIRRHLDREEETWLELLAGVHDRKFGSGPAQGRPDLARRARFLEYRGFTSAQVSRFLRFSD